MKEDVKGFGREDLEDIKVRFSKNAMDVIRFLAETHRRSKAEIIRLAVDNRLIDGLGKFIFLDRDYLEKIYGMQYAIFTEIQGVRNELHRIGINYNQEMKLKHIEKKYKAKPGCMDIDAIVAEQREKEEVIADSSNLTREELDELLTRFETATGKVCDALCRILG